ncbi:MAG TPA: hypothetical protein VL120_05735 [Solirubrobacteraceae bacterium]|nr:hypothetical protein [Solirubrobacteraceae bacterium]
MTLAACGAVIVAATAALALAGAAGAQAPLVTAPEVVPAASAPEPLWVPDPEPDTFVAGEAEPAADVAAGATQDAAPIATDAAQAAVAHWMAKGARDAGLPSELPVMASLHESGLRNLPWGDRDSVGYFQMRTSIWDHGTYAGYLARPELQLRWFIDQALAVRAARVAAGDIAFGTDPEQWGEWIADVERPAAPNRGFYQPQLETARALLATPAPALAPFELALTLDGTPAATAPADPLAARVVTDARIVLSDNARADLVAGRIDPRLEAVLLQAAERAPIAISVLQTGHPYLTVNGSVSNHSFGRAADIATVDGAPVSPGNAAARELALALGTLSADIRPTEIGSPWAIDDPAYFTDGDHQDHLHVGFDDPAAAVTAGGEPALAAAAAAAPAPAVALPAARPGLEPAEPHFDAGATAPAGGGGGVPSEPRFRAAEVTP